MLVVGYRTDEFPAFTTASSGLPVEARVDSPGEAAELVRAHRRLGLPGAIVLAQPPPADLALPREEMESALAAALRRAEERGVAGKAITPFLLDAIRESTGGRSLAANRVLIVANARLAGEVAAELAASAAPPRSWIARSGSPGSGMGGRRPGRREGGRCPTASRPRTPRIRTPSFCSREARSVVAGAATHFRRSGPGAIRR